jgi:hypothetical protein
MVWSGFGMMWSIFDGLEGVLGLGWLIFDGWMDFGRIGVKNGGNWVENGENWWFLAYIFGFSFLRKWENCGQKSGKWSSNFGVFS